MITKMKKILLAGKIEDREKVLTVLRTAELVHVDPAVPEKIRIPEALSSEYEDCAQALSILSQLTDKKDDDLLETPGTPTRLVEETLSHNKNIVELKNRLNLVNRELEEVKKWDSFGLKDLEYLKNEGVNILFLKGSIKNVEEIEAECTAQFFLTDKTEVIACFSRKEIKYSDKFIALTLPKRELSKVSDEIQTITKSIQDNEHALHCLKQRYADIEAHLNKLNNKKRFKEVETGVFCEDKLFVLTGWCPEDKTQDLQKTFEEAGVSVGMDFLEPEEGDTPPTKLDNSAFASCASPLFKLMGMLPSYREPDTSFLFILSMVLFASFIMADLGYGLLFALPLIIFYKKLISKGVDKNLIRMLLLFSIGTSVYGLITNSFFGFSPFNFGWNPSGKDMVLWQKLCLFIGAIHLTLAHTVKIKNKPKNLAIIGEIGWLLFLWAMYGLLCYLITGEDLGMLRFSVTLKGQMLFVWMFEISALMILFFTQPSLNPIKSVLAGVGSILSNASGMFSDILSYIRLWAVGLAGGKVAAAFNDIGLLAVDSLPAIIGYTILIVVFFCGHLLNIILSCISVLSHGVRLNLLEFTNHLGLEWAGKEYEPFKENQ
ncbi:MAG: hypothetical protein J6Z11_14430 [Candidatus Riflebacteria bacterium]|nr:hypothetical protein [Candidatus Riflebacteria bacterium]